MRVRGAGAEATAVVAAEVSTAAAVGSMAADLPGAAGSMAAAEGSTAADLPGAAAVIGAGSAAAVLAGFTGADFTVMDFTVAGITATIRRPVTPTTPNLLTPRLGTTAPTPREPAPMKAAAPGKSAAV